MRTLFPMSDPFASRIAFCVVVGAMLLLPSERPLQAATSTVYACVTPSGAPRVISTSPLTCHRAETLITWNQQGAEGGKGLQVVDSLGKVLGPLLAPSFVGIHVGDQWLTLSVQENNATPGVYAFFETTDCSGTAYLYAADVPPLARTENSIVYYPAAPHQVRTFQSQSDSVSGSGTGCNGPFVQQVFSGAAMPFAFDLSSFVPPFKVQSQ